MNKDPVFWCILAGVGVVCMIATVISVALKKEEK